MEELAEIDPSLKKHLEEQTSKKRKKETEIFKNS